MKLDVNPPVSHKVEGVSEESVGPPEPGDGWDAVDEASWESFPASDTPAWGKQEQSSSRAQDRRT